ncbi:MAG: DUF58 domain-containing protein [Chloroflexota bacterium]
MTTRFWVLLGCMYGLLFLGLATLQGGLIVLAIPLLLYLGTAIFYAPRQVKLVPEREIDVHLVESGTPVAVQVTLRNEGEPIDEIYLADHIPPQAECIQGAAEMLAPLAQDETLQCNYTLRCERGRHALKGLSVEVNEHFAVFQQRFFFPASVEFQTLPDTPRLKRLHICPRQTRGFSGSIPARQSGSGMSFWGVREYQLGDPLRRINWKVSARQRQNLFTNDFEQERIADVGLILDARQQTNNTVGEKTLFEHSVRAVAALADIFLTDGHRVSLLTYGFGLRRVFPGYGKIQRERILQALAKVEVGSNYALESLDYLPTRLFPARSQLVVISPLGMRDYPTFVRLCKDGYSVLLISPDPVSFEAQAFRSAPEVEQAARLAHLERNLLLRRLIHLGVQVVDWQVGQPFEQVVYAALGRQFQSQRNPKMVSL